ncbi:type VI secretion system contractile sheath large subunit [Nitrospirillum sp. BR 11164]|uniref:type VI secretion system contractile sheath large subunit n=1 Tax=Nitrospirillum sp. BR 11164 TaxID=3104324 RepID=UPI002AFE4091|nr:type VI secretion system contractile sheath large subunit [Nitrospirillum sp. BR 11164]MEA1649103.1 type VI secretion system contractile sheath large subunit [Nitrospirillum sp. BR 11164]
MQQTLEAAAPGVERRIDTTEGRAPRPDAPPAWRLDLSRHPDKRLVIDQLIAAIDALLTAQVNAILHNPRFQQLEASWRGLLQLVEASASTRAIKIRVLDVSWRELCRDFERAIEFDQSQLFTKVYSDEFGTPGGEPFGLLIGDYAVQHQRDADHPTDDVGTLKAIAAVAAAAFCPFVTSCSPALFGLDSFGDMASDVDLARSFEGHEFIRWRALREADDARFIGIALPKVMMRPPYRHDPNRIDGFRFMERTGRPGAGDYLWGNAAFAFATVVMRAFHQYGWFADIRGAPDDLNGGGLVDGFPGHTFPTLGGAAAPAAPLDVYLSDRQEKQLSDLGIVPLSRVSYVDACVFYSCQSLHQPKVYDRATATSNARLSAMLQYVLCASRFAHYIKMIGRDKIGSFATAHDFEEHLRDWLRGYCLANDDASTSFKARYPLREAEVQVRDIAGRPGAFGCVIHLKPHFQLDDVQTSFRLVTELVGPQA